MNDKQTLTKLHSAIAAAEDATKATIERCAQVAEWFSNVEKFTAEDVAARIRALKDKP